MSKVGELINGRYKILAVLGEGGMGTVYEAINTFTERHVAIKTLQRDSGMSAPLLARFLREGRAVSRLEHPHIVQVLDMGEDADGSLFIVQELLRGQDLRRWLERRHRVSIEETLAIVLPVMDALCAAHNEGIIHRDVKPENIFLARSLEGKAIPKLIDFGVAGEVRKAHKQSDRITNTGVPIGTASYMSPEQARGESDIDAQSDVWSIGAVLFELLAGRRPFEGTNFNIIVAQVLTTTAPRLDTIVPDISVSLADLIARALAPEREKRFADMHSFREALLAWCNENNQTLPDRSASIELSEPLPLDEKPGTQHTETLRSHLTEEIPPPTQTLPSRKPTEVPLGRLPYFFASVVVFSLSTLFFVRSRTASTPVIATASAPPPAPAPPPAQPMVVAPPSTTVDAAAPTVLTPAEAPSVAPPTERPRTHQRAHTTRSTARDAGVILRTNGSPLLPAP